MLLGGNCLLSMLSARPRPIGLLALILLAIVLLPSDAAQARRYASIVIDAESGQVLHAENADRQAFPASLTKMMTLYMAFEALDLGTLKMSQPLTVSRRAAGMAPSKLGLRPGQTILVKDAVMTLITKSANDIAVVIAEALAGSEADFARLMTKKAQALGMTQTVFRNASGLPNKQQLSTARDMARLAQSLLRHFPDYYKLFSTRSFTYKGRTFPNHNRLLRTYSGTDGVKTGYTHASGYNLVASTVRGNRRLIAVVFGGKTSRSRDKHMAKLLDRGFATIRTATQIEPLPSAPRRKPLAEPDAIQVAAASATRAPEAADSVLTAAAGMAAAALVPPALAEDADRQAAEGAAWFTGDSPRFHEIPKRENYHSPRGAPNSPVPHPPALAAIPERSDYDSAQGSAESPVPMPPPYASIPRRPAVNELESSAAPSAGAQFKLIAKRSLPNFPLWGIQVGAYRQIAPAQVAAQRAAQRLPSDLRQAEIHISPMADKEGKVFRARLMGFDEANARRACSRLEAFKISCYVVTPEASG